MIERAFIFVFGSVVGSFLNVCIHRLPLAESVIRPASHCPHCKKGILWYDNIPLVSFLLLKGRCRFCKERISARYFMVELLTACAFLAVYGRTSSWFEFIFYATFISSLIVATFVDIAHRIIPDEISLGVASVGLLLQLLRPLPTGAHYSFAPIIDGLLGVVVGGGIIWLTGTLFDLVYFKLLKRPPIQGETESMGGGDVKLLAMIGAFLGWQQALLTFFLSPIIGAAFGIVNLLVKKDHTIAFGPFLSIASIISLFWFGPIVKYLFPYF